MTISFKIRSEFEREEIDRIAERALRMDERFNGRTARTKADWLMDITAAHANGCRLKLTSFAEADDANFAHDAFGIASHLDRKTGELGCFLPRFAA